jgi:glyoxylase-like metal-dependent hydrolase (beta-lactamase superfamily II)
MEEVQPSVLAAVLAEYQDGPFGEFMHHAFGAFDLAAIEVAPVTRTFSDMMELSVGDRRVELRMVGPANTAADVIAWLPEDRVVFAGDLLFIGGTPIMWSGPISRWIAACDLIEALDPLVIIPGHGPLTDTSGARDVGDYLRSLSAEVAARHAAGMTPHEASRDIGLLINGSRFGTWTDRERLVVTVHSAWQALDPL